ncbi:MAG TPA: tripartite tricarboxylate transporter substrate-binding protein, partial [Paenalcaligenes sp.]|nr:tripartite tricarboxylate transporter substrate-binding protein [Paenalcaligenes sp.]
MARLIGASLSEQWDQSVVVENRTGAGGNIGTGLVASAKPDGYTILMASGANLTINPHLYDNLSFDVSNDFAPITNVATGPMVVAVSETITAPTLADFIKDASANPAHYTIGSAGVGSQGHLAGENFQVAADIDLVHVPYRGESAAFADLMAGQIDVVVGNIGAALAPLNSGRIR